MNRKKIHELVPALADGTSEEDEIKIAHTNDRSVWGTPGFNPGWILLRRI
jgi:hypothetical protein